MGGWGVGGVIYRASGPNFFIAFETFALTSFRTFATSGDPGNAPPAVVFVLTIIDSQTFRKVQRQS